MKLQGLQSKQPQVNAYIYFNRLLHCCVYGNDIACLFFKQNIEIRSNTSFHFRITFCDWYKIYIQLLDLMHWKTMNIPQSWYESPPWPGLVILTLTCVWTVPQHYSEPGRIVLAVLIGKSNTSVLLYLLKVHKVNETKLQTANISFHKVSMKLWRCISY
jgi:hypothetical protein